MIHNLHFFKIRAVIKSWGNWGPGFPLATMNVVPGYFHWKIEEK